MSETPQAQGGSGAMFDTIAARYDLLNRIISLGVDTRWRRRTVEALACTPAHRVLDLATGTADLALLTAQTYPGVRIVGLDPSPKMLEVGAQKLKKAGVSERITLIEGDAQHIPFEDNSFEGISMAFGIRNVPDRMAALREMKRVTKPNGRIAILELSEPKSGILGPLARFHIHSVVPWVGSVISGQKAYHYLQASIAAFPAPEDFAVMMREAGLKVLEVAPLSFGVSCLYVATPVKDE
jgi:demethylmenaquinone methyltransferase/2-methoxy-6-polyprenyl-1,4-benzoquinol methylase